MEWPCPLPGGGTRSELALVADQGGVRRLLIVPALFDEANRLRRFTVEVMRRLAGAGIDCFLPDLPGCNESTAPLTHQTPSDWQLAMAGAARHFAASHVLAIRGGALVAPVHLPGWRYAPATGTGQLRQMLRARIIASREAGVEETQEGLLTKGRESGLTLVGHPLGADFITEFHTCLADATSPQTTISQDMLGGSGLWLRAEPGENQAQADALAAIVAMGLAEAAA